MKRLSVLTCPDRREYLAETLASMDRAGALGLEDYDRVIYVDGSDSGYEHRGWRSERLAANRLGTKEALLHVMRLAARDGVEHLIYTEDDVLYARNALEVIDQIAVPAHLGFLTFCDLKHVATAPGITESPGYDFEGDPGEGGHWGNQALKIPARSLRLVLEMPEPEWTGNKASDILLGVLTATSPAPCRAYGVFYPSLAYHSGARSLVAPGAGIAGWGRQTPSFPGEDFDALTTTWRSPETHQAVLPRQMAPVDRIRLRFRSMGGAA